MTHDQRQDLKAVVKGAMAETALEFTKELHAVEKSLGGKIAETRDSVQAIPEMVNKKIEAYDKKQTTRRRWTIRTLIGTIAIVLSGIGLVLAYWP